LWKVNQIIENDLLDHNPNLPQKAEQALKKSNCQVNGKYPDSVEEIF